MGGGNKPTYPGSDTPWAKGPANSCTRASRNPWDKVPPHGRCTQSIKVNPSKLRGLGHRCIVVDFSDNSFVCICQLCAFHTTGARLAKLAEPCRGKPPPRNTAWSRLSKGLHPKRNGVTAELSSI